jgi:hypothetical protein
MLGQQTLRGRVAEYPMNCVEGDGKLTDISGNGLHATITGATPTTDHNGRANRAYLYDAANENINMGDINITNLYGATGRGTFVIGFKYVAEARQRVLFSKYNGSAQSEVLFQFLSDNRLQIYVFANAFASNLSTLIDASNFVDGTFYHLIVKYSNILIGNDKLKVYLNKTYLSNAVTNTGSFNGYTRKSANYIIGNQSDNLAARYYNSAIDYVGIFGEDWTDSEFTQKYYEWLK